MAQVAGIIALVSGAVALAFTLEPSLKPDPGTSISASMSVVTVEPHVRFGDWLHRLTPKQRGSAGAGIPAEVLNARGYIVYLEVQVDGRKRHVLQLAQSIYNQQTKIQLVPAADTVGFRSDTPSDRWITPAFVQDPGFGEAVFARFELEDHGTILAMSDSPALHFPA